MQDIFKRESSRAESENYSVSVIMLDMDELKDINDLYGHHAGDLATQLLASTLRHMTRLEDVVFRYGGDEFTVILTRTTPEDAVKRVNEWLKFMDNNPLQLAEDTILSVKFTAGIAGFPAHGNSIEQVINYADVALYRAKARGRTNAAIFT